MTLLSMTLGVLKNNYDSVVSNLFRSERLTMTENEVHSNWDNLARMKQFSTSITGGNMDESSVNLAGVILDGNSPTQISIARLTPDAKTPTKAHKSDAGWDLYSTESKIILSQGRSTIKTGILLAIPDGHVGLIWPRSGLAVKKGINILAGVIDSGYRGEIQVALLNTDTKDPVTIEIGDRIAQILIQPISLFDMVVVESLTDTDRGDGGFGSSGS